MRILSVLWIIFLLCGCMVGPDYKPPELDVPAAANIKLLGLDDQLRIARETLETYAQSVKLFELRFKYGQVSQMTVEQARSQYETAAAAIPQIENQIAQMENAICILLGRNPGHVKRGKTLHQLQPPPVPAGLPSDLLTNRPDIRQAEQNLISANAQIGAAKALYFPSISLTGALGLASSDLSSLFQGPARIWSYEGTITGPIFTGGAIQGQVKEAEAIQKAALLNYEQTVQNSFADVENALVSREKLHGTDSRPRNGLSRPTGSMCVWPGSSTREAIPPTPQFSRPSSSCSPRNSITPSTGPRCLVPWSISIKPWAVDGSRPRNA